MESYATSNDLTCTMCVDIVTDIGNIVICKQNIGNIVIYKTKIVFEVFRCDSILPEMSE